MMIMVMLKHQIETIYFADSDGSISIHSICQDIMKSSEKEMFAYDKTVELPLG